MNHTSMQKAFIEFAGCSEVERTHSKATSKARDEEKGGSIEGNCV